MKKLKSLVKEKQENYTFRIKPSDVVVIRKNAAKYTGGNISAWMRYAAVNFQPKESELINE